MNETGSDAYKRVLAWISVFKEEGYYSINHEGSDAQAEYPYLKTLEIIHQIRQNSFESIMSQTLIEHATDANKILKPLFAAQKENEIVDVYVGMRGADKTRLKRFCRETKLTQSEAIRLLLDHTENGTIQDTVAAAIADREDKISQLQEQLAIAKKRQIKRETKETVLLSCLKDALRTYMHHLYPNNSLDRGSKLISYKKFTRRLPWGIKYSYPEGEGHIIISLDALLVSSTRSHAYFVVGKTDDGHYYKLRYYSRAEYAGIRIFSSPYATPNSRWILLFTEAPDGAKDLCGALPLLRSETDNATESKPTEQLHPSLDFVINMANVKKQNM